MAMSTPSDPSVPRQGGPPAAGTGGTDRPGSYGDTTYVEGTYGAEVPGQPPTTTGTGDGGGAKEKAQEARAKAQEVAQEARATAQETASVAADEGRSVATTAADQARSVAETAKGEARNVTVEAKSQAQRVLGDAHGELQSQLDQRVGQAVEKARTTGDQLRALAEGRVDEAGPAVDWVRQAGDQVQHYADRLNDMGLEGATQELRRFARQRPMVFLGAAAAAGFLIGRTLKNASAAESRSSSTGGNGYDGSRPIAGADPYAPAAELDLTTPRRPDTTQTPGATLGTEYTPLGGELSDAGVARPSEGLR
jgi:hypothetical protein